MPKVSVIIPIYNVANYLSQCLDSILAQTLQDIEIILIDDGSTDRGAEICDEYAEKDIRVKVIHKSNQGLSAARNDGVAAANSPFIMFVDADDWVNPEFCDIPYQIAIQDKVDLVFFGYNCIGIDGSIKQMPISMQAGLLNEEKALHFNIHYTPAVWLGLYRRELFDEVHYPVGKIYEEVATTHRLIHQAGRIYLVDKTLYNYRLNRPGSITTNPVTKEHPDLKEMSIRKANDLHVWGYNVYASELAISLLAKYGLEKSLIDIVKEGSLAGLNWKKKVMLTIFKISPALFDTISIAMGRRVECKDPAELKM